MFGRLYSRFTTWLGVPSNAAIRKWCLDWDFAQTNDQEIWASEPDLARFRSARALRDSDPAAALAEFQALVQQGSIWSMMEVGYCLWKGRGTDVDRDQAEQWYGAASQNGCQRALLEYIMILLNRGDLDQAEAALGPAVADDWAPALYWQASIRMRRAKDRETMSQVLPLLERAAEKGSRYAQWTLAKEMSWGRFGLDKVPEGHRLLGRFSGAALADLTEKAVTDSETDEDSAGQWSTAEGVPTLH